ncbi:glycosyltransferase [Trueperella pecoris]|uniref:glycosyltransferase n=1 Tax=Trueperella pecoris TaxID=2733571 RepID=UPI001ABECA5C|nr:glycosyltransferase [Trueperella pecoris]QTG75108.1 glycosyltransferase [Trueperella pecoris]
MHVVWTPSWYPSVDHPLNGSFFAEQVQMLREAGLEVGVLALDPHSFWQGKPGAVERSDEGRVLRRAVPVLPKGVVPGDQGLIDHYAKPLAAAYEVAHGRPDVVHAHSVFPGLLLARALADHWGVPFGITEHRPSSLERSPGPRLAAISRAVSRTQFRLTVSAGMARRATDFYGLDFEALPLPVSPAFIEVERERGEDDHFVFLHMSMLDRNKRPEETVRAFAEVHRQYPQARLLVGGGKADRVAQVREVACALGVVKAVTFLGEVARSDVPALMANADCHVLFSAQEAGGVVFSEAHATGTASIASATDGGTFQVTKEMGMVVPVDDVGALARAMADMIGAKKAGAFGRNSVRAAAMSRVSAHVYATRTAEIYRGISGL